jgi:hypothetical protein
MTIRNKYESGMFGTSFEADEAETPHPSLCEGRGGESGGCPAAGQGGRWDELPTLVIEQIVSIEKLSDVDVASVRKEEGEGRDTTLHTTLAFCFFSQSFGKGAWILI